MYSNSSELSGKRVLNSYIQKYYDYNGRNVSMDQLLAAVSYDHTRYLQILGTAFEDTGSDSDLLDEALDKLVSELGIKIPDSGAYIEAMCGQVGGFKIYTQALSSSVSEVSDGLQFLGNQSILTAKILTYLLPVIVIGGLYYVGKSYLDKARAT